MAQPYEEAPVRRLHPVGGRVPPHNLDAEESLLGAMLLSRDAIAAALECCVAEDFYKPAHGHVFAAVTALYTRVNPPTPSPSPTSYVVRDCSTPWVTRRS